MNVYQFRVYEEFFQALKLSCKDRTFLKAYTPIHHEEVANLTKVKNRYVNIGFYTGGFSGLMTALLITYIPNAITFKINVGGRPLESWPAFAIIGFELMILLGGLGAVLGFILSNRYPRFDREIFDLEEFNQKNQGEYFLVTHKELKDVKAHRHYQLHSPS